MDKPKLSMDFSKLLHGFVEIGAWISISVSMDLQKLVYELYIFVKVTTWICYIYYLDFSKLFYLFLGPFVLIFYLCTQKLCFLAVQDSSLTDIVCPSVGLSVGAN